MTTREVLLGAADLIEAHGLVKGDYVCGKRHCAAGAIDAVAGKRLDPDDGSYYLTEGAEARSKAARAVLRLVIGQSDITLWNDQPERTQAEVVAALREAAGLA